MSHYNESEKILLLHQYVRSGLTLHEFSSRHGIPLSTFHRIYTEYGSPDVSSVAYLMKKEDIPVQLEALQAQLLRERKAHEKEIKRLEKELAVEKLKSLGIQISMTQTGDPLHNALAERMNNTLKNGWLFSTEDKSLQQVRRLTKKAIDLYNTFRPHQSLQMRTPMEEVGRLTA